MSERRQSWWRKARAPLIALVVLVPAAIAAGLSVDAFDYLNSRPRVVTTVAAGEATRLGEVGFRLTDSWVAEADSAAGVEYGVPTGTALVSVTVEIDPTDASEEFTSCEMNLLQPGPDRRWGESIGDTDYWPDHDAAGDVPVGCAPFASAYPRELVFVIPADAVGQVVVEVVIGSKLPQALQLRLPD